MDWNSLFPLVNPFVPNPELQKPENNFIENAISNGIEKGVGNVGDKIIHAGQTRLEGFMQNLPAIMAIGVTCYIVYIGFKTLWTGKLNDIIKIMPVIMFYIMFKLVWVCCILK